ncbi:hypothetical protein KSP39_PZI006817 [Platanthera zijinensis]|uniref:Uncharacterized protein n=1 Tax=Platanthera zijinensis TaxID=2320716 RepID=A0AAP0G9L9_9ASPA
MMTVRARRMPNLQKGEVFQGRKKERTQKEVKMEQQVPKKGKLIVPKIDYTKLPKIPTLGSAAFHQWFSPFFDDVEISDDDSEGEEDAQPSKKGKSSKGGRKRGHRKK